MPTGRVKYGNDGRVTYYVSGKEVTKAKFDKVFPSKIGKDGVEMPLVSVVTRDDRWSRENNGRGHEVMVGEDKPVYFQSKGDLERYCADRGLTTSTDWSNLADTSKHKQAQPVQVPRFDPDAL